MRSFFGVVGVAMFLGFGAAVVSTVRDLHAFPAEPRPMTVAEAMDLEDPGPGAWVRLTDARFPCVQALRHSGSGGDVYRLAFGRTEDERVIVSAPALPCSDAPRSVVGVLDVAKPGRTAGLEFPGYPFERWPRGWQTSLWTSSGPEDSRDLVVLLSPAALLGLVIAAAGWKPEKKPPVPRELTVAEVADDAPWRAGEQVLPPRRLGVAGASLYDRVLVAAVLAVLADFLGALAWASRTLGGPLGWVGVIAFGALAVFLVVVLVRLPLNWWREGRLGRRRVEALVELLEEQVVLAAGADVGNRAFVFAHPLSGERTRVAVGFQEPWPLKVNGRLFVVHAGDNGPVVVMREGFAPFDLTPAEQEAAMRRLVRFGSSMPDRGSMR